MKTKARIGFVGFHSSFNARDYGLVRMLREQFDLDIVDTSSGQVPDFLFFSVYDYPHRDSRYDDCIKIFTTEENIRIPWTECDFAVTGDYVSNPHHLRVPIYVKTLTQNPEHPQCSLIKPPRTTDQVRDLCRSKTRFCNFIVSNPHSRPRLKFYKILSKYKTVDSGGEVFNNLGHRVGDKLAFVTPYKFTIAFENSRHPGYVTEKIVEPMLSDSVPIYWGDRRVLTDEINPLSIVDANEPADCLSLDEHFERVVEEIIRLDQDDDAYMAKVVEPWLPNNQPSPYLASDYATSFFEKVFADPHRKPNRQPGPIQSWQELEGRDWMLPSYWLEKEPS